MINFRQVSETRPSGAATQHSGIAKSSVLQLPDTNPVPDSRLARTRDASILTLEKCLRLDVAQRGECQMPWVRARNFQKGSRGNLGELEVAQVFFQIGAMNWMQTTENCKIYIVDF